MHPSSLVAVRRERRPSLIQTLSRCNARQGSLKLPAAGYLSMNTAAWQPLRTPPEPVNASLKTEDKGSRSGNDIGYGRFRACSKAAPGACFRRKQHLGAGGDHDPGVVGSSHRGLRSQSLLPCEILALCRKI